MNVTFNSNRYQNYNYQNSSYNHKNRFKQNVGFTGNPAAELSTEVEKAARGSKLFKPFKKAYNNATDWMAKNIFAKIVNNKTVQNIADKIKNNNSLFNHFMAIGSLITSGLYIQKTLDNKQLDKDRRNTLAINQTLTFGVSTVGAYSLDKSLNNWWNKVTAKYAGIQLNDPNFANDYQTALKAVAEKNQALKAANKNLPKAQRTPLEIAPRVGEFLKKHKDYNPEIHEILSKKITGMGLLKSMIIFGTVYRFLVPVLVTPIANKLGEHMIEQRKAREAAKLQAK